MTTEIKWKNLSEDTSHADLAQVWDVLGTPIYHVLDEYGVNVSSAQIRNIDGDHWLYVDDDQGWSIMSAESAEQLPVVLEEDDPEIGYPVNA